MKRPLMRFYANPWIKQTSSTQLRRWRQSLGALRSLRRARLQVLYTNRTRGLRGREMNRFWVRKYFSSLS